MAASIWISLYTFTYCILLTLQNETPTPEGGTQPPAMDLYDHFNPNNPNALPGMTFEFKIEIGAGAEECFYQHMKQGSEFHLSFEVLRGADRNVDVFVRDPNGKVVESHQWKSEGTVEKNLETTGVYSMCVDNSFSRFSAKLVYLYVVSYHVQEWEQFSKEVEDLELTASNFTVILKSVEHDIDNMKKSQAISRKYMMRDWYVVHSNNRYIQYWSVLQIVIVVATASLQVYFVRRLFYTSSVTPTSKPRA